jgi:Ca2+/Na+ antiporter
MNYFWHIFNILFILGTIGMIIGGAVKVSQKDYYYVYLIVAGFILFLFSVRYYYLISHDIYNFW